VFKKVSRTDKPFLDQLRKIGEKSQRKPETKKEAVEIGTTEIQRITRVYYELLANKLDNLEEMDKFLDMYILQRLNHNRKAEQNSNE
jgi:hypothetical protein